MSVTLEELNIYDPYNAYYSKIKGNRFELNKFMDQMLELPENLYDFVFTSKMPHILKDKIAASFQLSQEQSQKLAIVLMKIIVAQTYLGHIVEEIQKQLNIDQEKAKQIANAVIKEILLPIWEELKKLHLEKFGQKKIAKEPEKKSSPPSLTQPMAGNVINLKEEK